MTWRRTIVFSAVAGLILGLAFWTGVGGRAYWVCLSAALVAIGFWHTRAFFRRRSSLRNILSRNDVELSAQFEIVKERNPELSTTDIESLWNSIARSAGVPAKKIGARDRLLVELDGILIAPYFDPFAGEFKNREGRATSPQVVDFADLIVYLNKYEYAD